MEDGHHKIQLFHNRNSRRVQKYLTVSVDNEHSNCHASNHSHGLKIAPNSSTAPPKCACLLSGLSNPPEPPHSPSHDHSTALHDLLKVRTLLRLSLYLVIVLLALGGHLGADAAAVKAPQTSLASSNKEVTNGRTFKYGEWRGRKQKKAVNKNCKEYGVTSRAFLADLIFEGTARSRSKRASGRYVTFVIQKILKQKGNLLRPKTQIRLHFGEREERRTGRATPGGDCPWGGGRAMANVKVGEKYYVFADHVGPMNYTAKGEPIVINKRNLKSIRSVLSRNKEKPPRVLGLQDLNLKIAQQLRLNCQVRGRPVPRINWFKDGAPLIPSSRVNVTYYRRNSTIEIKSVELKDGGAYECRATSVTGKMAKTSAHVSIWKFYTPSTTDPEKSFHIKKCSVDAYCLNGGQCYFIEHLGEHMCECEPGYNGARCEIKEVSAIELSPGLICRGCLKEEFRCYSCNRFRHSPNKIYEWDLLKRIADSRTHWWWYKVVHRYCRAPHIQFGLHQRMISNSQLKLALH